MTAPWDADIDKILGLAQLKPDALCDQRMLREFMIAAWQHGYTTGMADSAKIDQIAADEARQRGLVWNPMKMAYDPAPEPPQ